MKKDYPTKAWCRTPSLSGKRYPLLNADAIDKAYYNGSASKKETVV